MSDEQFNEERLTNLINRYNDGSQQLWATYAQKAELVHLIIREVRKRGCKATLSATLARLNPPIKYSTARYMSWWHQTYTLRELPDPDAPDPRNTLITNANGTAMAASSDNGQPPTSGQNKTAPPSKPRNPRAPMIIFALKGEIGIAVAVLKRFFGFPDFLTTVKESLLRLYRQVETPTVEMSGKADADELGDEAEEESHDVDAA